MEKQPIIPQEGQEALETQRKLEILGKDLQELAPSQYKIPRKQGQYEEIFGHK